MSIENNIQAGLLLAVTIGLFPAGSVLAAGGKLFNQTGCACCPVCDHVCKLDAEQVEEEKTCFEVESKAICIPRVVFPWQKAKQAACASCDACAGQGCTACVHNGARVRKVCVLKTDKYKCPACKYTWTAEKKTACGCGPGCCVGGCSSAAACDGGCAATPVFLNSTNASVSPTPVADSVVDQGDYYRRPGEPLPIPPAAAEATAAN